MYYLLDYNIVDQKKDTWFEGSLYNKQQNDVDNMFLFSTGNKLNENEIHAPFTLILDEKGSSLKNKINRDKISTSTVGAGFLLLVSSAAKMLFEKLKIDNMQYFDIIVKSKNFELHDYKIVNITDKIDCLDISASDIDMKSQDQIRSISSLVLIDNKIPKGKQIFLLGRKKSAIIIVHENMKKSIEQGGLTGFRFIEFENAGELY